MLHDSPLLQTCNNIGATCKSNASCWLPCSEHVTEVVSATVHQISYQISYQSQGYGMTLNLLNTCISYSMHARMMI